ncbi:hypothetical protein AYL99_07829 [Fonsecaea erecta]|uniref:Rhodopsin domain-containing protein n=1 Tax=Fonsecaea erecta TaxID=1367422 RepID=A0A178ZG20_9EURO|nr:hypothetical protein AYL99_07829 [Fonsecaea erecta]OAP58739.1 hypothetical protein AYL99_07829 [Fonsecaea erecta]
MGEIVVVVSGLRLIVVNQFATTPDFTYILGRMILISAVEIQVGIFAANMPGLKAFYSIWRKGELSSSGSRGTKESQGSSAAGVVSSGHTHQLATLWNKRGDNHRNNNNNSNKGLVGDDKVTYDADEDADGPERRLTRRGRRPTYPPQTGRDESA